MLVLMTSYLFVLSAIVFTVPWNKPIGWVHFKVEIVYENVKVSDLGLNQL